MKFNRIQNHSEINVQKNAPFNQVVFILSDNLKLELYLLVATISLFDMTYCILQPMESGSKVAVFKLIKDFGPSDTLFHYVPLNNSALTKFILYIYQKVISSKKNFYVTYKDSANHNKHVLIDSISVYKSTFDLIAAFSPMGTISVSFYKRCFRLFPKITKLHTHIKVCSKTINDNLFSTFELIFQLNNGFLPHKKGSSVKIST